MRGLSGVLGIDRAVGVSRDGRFRARTAVVEPIGLVAFGVRDFVGTGADAREKGRKSQKCKHTKGIGFHGKFLR